MVKRNLYLILVLFIACSLTFSADLSSNQLFAEKKYDQYATAAIGEFSVVNTSPTFSQIVQIAIVLDKTKTWDNANGSNLKKIVQRNTLAGDRWLKGIYIMLTGNAGGASMLFQSEPFPPYSEYLNVSNIMVDHGYADNTVKGTAFSAGNAWLLTKSNAFAPLKEDDFNNGVLSWASILEANRGTIDADLSKAIKEMKFPDQYRYVKVNDKAIGIFKSAKRSGNEILRNGALKIISSFSDRLIFSDIESFELEQKDRNVLFINVMKSENSSFDAFVNILNSFDLQKMPEDKELADKLYVDALKKIKFPYFRDLQMAYLRQITSWVISTQKLDANVDKDKIYEAVMKNILKLSGNNQYGLLEADVRMVVYGPDMAGPQYKSLCELPFGDKQKPFSTAYRLAAWSGYLECQPTEALKIGVNKMHAYLLGCQSDTRNNLLRWEFLTIFKTVYFDFAKAHGAILPPLNENRYRRNDLNNCNLFEIKYNVKKISGEDGWQIYMTTLIDSILATNPDVIIKYQDYDTYLPHAILMYMICGEYDTALDWYYFRYDKVSKGAYDIKENDKDLIVTVSTSDNYPNSAPIKVCSISDLFEFLTYFKRSPAASAEFTLSFARKAVDLNKKYKKITPLMKKPVSTPYFYESLAYITSGIATVMRLQKEKIDETELTKNLKELIYFVRYNIPLDYIRANSDFGKIRYVNVYLYEVSSLLQNNREIIQKEIYENIDYMIKSAPENARKALVNDYINSLSRVDEKIKNEYKEYLKQKYADILMN